MKKFSKSRTPRQRQDAQLEEFETQDLGKDIRTSGVRPVIVQPKTRPTSILLDVELIQQLRVKAAKRGIGYQTMLKMIVREHLHEY